MDKKKVIAAGDIQLNKFRKLYYSGYHGNITENLSLWNRTKLTTAIEAVCTTDILEFLINNLDSLPKEINNYEHFENLVSAGISSDIRVGKYKEEILKFVSELKFKHPEFSLLPSQKELSTIYKFFIDLAELLK